MTWPNPNPSPIWQVVDWPHVVSISKKGEPKSYLTSKWKPTLLPNKTILAQLMDTSTSNDATASINNEILRRYFLELTESFLAPFEEYFLLRGVGGAQSPILKPFASPPSLKPFDEADFLKRVGSFEQHSPDFKAVTGAVRGSSKLVGLYTAFLRGPHFTTWFAERRREGERVLEDLWRHARYNSQIKQLMTGLRDVELVELYMRIKGALDEECRREVVNSKVCDRLREQLLYMEQHTTPELRKVMDGKARASANTHLGEQTKTKGAEGGGADGQEAAQETEQVAEAPLPPSPKGRAVAASGAGV